MKPYGAVFFFTLFLVAGMWITDHAWNGQVFVYVGEERAPAATRSLLDYSSLDRKAIWRSAHKQLLANAEIVKRGGYVGVQLGHPLLSREGGRTFGCQVQDHSGVFDHIEITFVGTGISEDGMPARMTVDSPCRSIKNLNRLETVWIPMGDIFASTPKDQELQLFGQNPVMVRLEQIPSQWPQNWVLWSIRLYSERNPSESLAIDARLLKEARPKLLSFDWQN